MTKTEMTIIILEFLKSNPKTQIEQINHKVEEVLKQQGMTLSNEDVMLVNEVIWDLIVERVVTPGMDKEHTQFPWLRVTNMESLESRLTHDY